MATDRSKISKGEPMAKGKVLDTSAKYNEGDKGCKSHWKTERKAWLADKKLHEAHEFSESARGKWHKKEGFGYSDDYKGLYKSGKKHGFG